jgi:hypothetical protein
MSLVNAKTGSRTAQISVKAIEGNPDQQSRVSQWTGGVCVGDMSGSDVKISGETCGSEAGASTGGASLLKGKAVRADTGVGGIHSSDDLMPNLCGFGERIGERRDATCSAVEKSGKEPGDGPKRLLAPDKVRRLQIALYRKAVTPTVNGTRKAGCGKTACPV